VTHTTPLISVVIATRERWGVIERCFEHLFSQDYGPFETIVVDNSPDARTAEVVSRFPVTYYIRENPRTDNVSYLKNIGVNCARGQIVALLDDDSLVQPGWMQAVAVGFESPDVGGVTGRVIEDAFPVDNSPAIARLSPRDDMICNFNNLWPQPVEVDYLYGCNMAWRREALIKVGGLDPWMNYSRGEQEWSLRIKRAGYRLIFCPGAMVHHLRAPRVAEAVQRSGTKSARSRLIHCRSLTYQYARHFGISTDLLKLTLWKLPKGAIWQFRQDPGLRQAVIPLATIAGIIWGYTMAAATAAGLHSVSPCSELRSIRGMPAVNMPHSSGMIADHSTRQPSVSVIIPTRDRAMILEQCLQHVYTQEGGPLETVVVDNSLDQQSTLAIVGRFPGTTYVRANPTKCNPALMRNLGIQVGRGDILAFIDDDTLVEPGWVRAMREAFADPTVGGVTGRVIETDAPEVSTMEIGRFSPRGEITMNFNNTIDRPVPVEFLYGCNMAVRRSVLNRIGQYDPWYGITYEEQDLSFRIRRAGYRTLYVPTMVGRHLKASRPAGVTHRSDESDLRSLYQSCRLLAYLCVSHFGPSSDFARVAFINLPKGAIRSFVDQPSVKRFLKIPALLAGCLAGYGMAATRALELHMPPKLNEIDPARQSGDEQAW
jgi:GT2 family glycosyltransferase